MTSAPFVVSTMTKLSDDTERRLTASAGYDSFVQYQAPPTLTVRGQVDKPRLGPARSRVRTLRLS